MYVLCVRIDINIKKYYVYSLTLHHLPTVNINIYNNTEQL